MSLTYEDNIVDTISVLFICISSVYIVFIVFIVAFVMHSIPLAVSKFIPFIHYTDFNLLVLVMCCVDCVVECY